MKKKEIFKEIDSLLEEIEVLEGVSLKKQNSEEISLREESILTQAQDHILENCIASDARVELRVSRDSMQLYMNLYPRKNGGRELVREMVVSLLKEKKILSVLKINWKEIERSIRIVNASEKPIFDELIASGALPRPHIPLQINLREELMADGYNEGACPDDDKECVDHREFCHCRIVKKDQVLADIVEETPGSNGYDVYGHTIPFEKRPSSSWKLGTNTKIQGSHVVSEIDGSLKLNGNVISVDKILFIPGNVDFSTGNVSFRGDISISGFVQDGFKVLSKGHVFCKENIYAADIECSKSLEVGKGILGRNKGRVICGGDLNAKYIENAAISCDADMHIEKGILNSEVFCSGVVELGHKSRIVSSRIYAQNGISTHELGNEAGNQVEVFCGIDYLLQNNLKKLQKKQYQLAESEANLVTELKKASSLRQREELTNRFKEIRAYKEKLVQTTITLLENLDQNEKAKITIRGRVFPGVYMEICHVSYIVQETLTNRIFFLNKKNGRIEHCSG